jgi:hypothetical protein
MKNKIGILIIIFSLCSCKDETIPIVSQNITEKENQNFVFFDSCSNKIISPKFEIFSMPELIYDYITVEKEIDDWVVQYTTSIKTNNDTIRIPKILFARGKDFPSKRWTYLNCDKVCNGTETDFYSNGNKRTEGTYVNGKPIERKEYWESGELHAHYFYDNFTIEYKKVIFYDENGNFVDEQIYENIMTESFIDSLLK